jgi:hypothetical protein
MNSTVNLCKAIDPFISMGNHLLHAFKASKKSQKNVFYENSGPLRTLSCLCSLLEGKGPRYNLAQPLSYNYRNR